MSQKDQQEPPGGLMGALVFGSTAAFVFYQIILQTFPSVMREGLTISFALDGAGFGGLSASFYYPYILLQIPSGLLVARYGPRRILVIGAILCAAASFWFAASQEVISADLARMTMGIGAGPSVVCAMTLAARWFPRRHFPLLVALVEIAGMVGAATGQEVLGWLVQLVGWRWSMISCGGVAILLCGTIAVVVRNWPPGHRPASDTEIVSLRAMLAILAKPRLLLISLAGGLIAVAGFSFGMLWAVPYFQQDAGLDVQKAAFVSSFYFWGCLPGMILAAILSSRTGRADVILGAGGVASALFLAAVLYATSSPQLMAVFMAGLGFFNASYAMGFTLVEREAPTGMRGVALGLANMMLMGVGAMIMQPLLGWLASLRRLEVPDSLTLGVLILAEIAGVLLLVAIRPHREAARG